MAEQNPIKYSDLIAPDDSIEKLITQLETLDAVYKGLAEDVRSQAASMTASLRQVSGATEEGRKSTRGASSDADRLAKAYQDLSFARSETAHKIAELKQAQREEQQITKLNIQLANTSAGSYNNLSAQYRLNKIALNNLTAEERASLPYAKKLEEETKAIYEEMKRLQEATGKFSLNVGNYENSINSVIGVQSKWFQGMRELGALFEGGFSAGVKNATGVVASFGKQLLSLLANPIVATIAAITAAFVALSNAITNNEENTNALMRVLAPFNRVLNFVVNALQDAAGWLLKMAEGMETATLRAARWLEKLPLVGNAIKKVNDALWDNIQLEKERQALQRDERQHSVEDAKLRAEAAKLRKEAEEQTDPNRRLQKLKEAEAKENEILQKGIALAQRQLESIREKNRQTKNSTENLEAEAEAEKKLYDLEAEYYRRTTRLASKQRTLQESMNRPTRGGTAVDDSAEQERQRKDAEKKELAAIRRYQDEKANLIENVWDRERVQTELRYDREIEDIRTRLETEENLTVDAKKALNATLAALEQEKWNKLADIADREMRAAVDAEQRDYEMRIKATNKMIRDQEDLRQKRKQAIQDSLDFALESVNQMIEGYVRAAEAKRQTADNEVEYAQRMLQMEMEARNAGYANDVETARKELQLARQTQQKAIADERRAQKMQEAIQTAEQVGSLVTAAAKIWGQLGYPWAIPAIAVMFASFAASKVMAADYAGSSGSETYGEGTVELLEGGSHQSGNDIDLGRKKDGTRRRAEGGEYFAVINKRNSRKYRDLIPEVINSLNNGTFAEKYMSSYGGGVEVNVGERADLREITDGVNDIREQGRRRQYSDGRGNTVLVYKNLKQTIKDGSGN